MDEKKTITLNGKTLTEEEFEKEKKRLEEAQVKLVESGNNTYKTRLND